MGKYRVRIKVELIECDEAKEHGVQKEGAGCFTMTISEKAVLLTAYPSIRDAISQHLSDLSKKKLLKKRGLDK